MYSKYFLLCKVATVVVLATFFVTFSRITFDHYLAGKTITSSSIAVTEDESQVLPAIIVCRKKAFNEHREMFTLEDFLNNTMKLEYYMDDENWNPVELNSTKLKRVSIYSVTRGHCIVLKYLPKVFSKNTLCYEQEFNEFPYI